MLTKEILDQELKKAGAEAISLAQSKLNSLLASDIEPWKKQAVGLLVSGLEDHGIEGITIVNTFLKDIIEGKSPDFTGVDLITASEVLAHLQKAEEENKKIFMDFISHVGKILGLILSATLKSILLK